MRRKKLYQQSSRDRARDMGGFIVRKNTRSAGFAGRGTHHVRASHRTRRKIKHCCVFSIISRHDLMRDAKAQRRAALPRAACTAASIYNSNRHCDRPVAELRKHIELLVSGRGAEGKGLHVDCTFLSSHAEAFPDSLGKAAYLALPLMLRCVPEPLPAPPLCRILGALVSLRHATDFGGVALPPRPPLPLPPLPRPLMRSLAPSRKDFL